MARTTLFGWLHSKHRSSLKDGLPLRPSMPRINRSRAMQGARWKFNSIEDAIIRTTAIHTQRSGYLDQPRVVRGLRNEVWVMSAGSRTGTRTSAPPTQSERRTTLRVTIYTRSTVQPRERSNYAARASSASVFFTRQRPHHLAETADTLQSIVAVPEVRECQSLLFLYVRLSPLLFSLRSTDCPGILLCPALACVLGLGLIYCVCFVVVLVCFVCCLLSEAGTNTRNSSKIGSRADLFI